MSTKIHFNTKVYEVIFLKLKKMCINNVPGKILVLKFAAVAAKKRSRIKMFKKNKGKIKHFITPSPEINWLLPYDIEKIENVKKETTSQHQDV